MPVTSYKATKLYPRGQLTGATRLAARKTNVTTRLAAPSTYARSAASSKPNPPTVTNVNPAAGTAITPTTPLTFNVTTSASGDAFTLIQLIASFPGLGILEVIYDYNTQQFGPQYQGPNNSVQAVTNGYAFTILRQNGWPASPTIIPYAVDSYGSENS